jgi:hypothetical protein
LPLSTLALDGSSGTPSRPDQPSRLLFAARYADLAVLVLALPVFLLIGASMLGYFAMAVAWLVQRGVQLAAERAATRALREGVRRNALGFLAGATLARLWIVTLTILVVGLAGSREAGLAAAVLALVLVTVSLGCRAFIHVFLKPEGLP